MQSPVKSEKSGCPDFEDLSCYVDEELDAGRTSDVREHLQSCQRCAGLTARLHQGLEDGVPIDRDGAPAGSECCDEEGLIIYLMRGLRVDQHVATEAHLQSCDACLYRVSLLRKRLRIDESVDAPVPAALRERVSDLVEAGAPNFAAEGAEDAPPTWLHRIRDSLDHALRLPILLPAAVAAGALLVVGVQNQPHAGTSGVRAVQHVSVLRVTAGRVVVRDLPRMSGEVVSELKRGDQVEVAGEDRDWYRVALPDNRGGWVERRAFE